MQELTIRLGMDAMWRLADAAARAELPVATFAGAVLADALEAGTPTAQNGVQGVAADAGVGGRTACCPDCGHCFDPDAE